MNSSGDYLAGFFFFLRLRLRLVALLLDQEIIGGLRLVVNGFLGFLRLALVLVIAGGGRGLRLGGRGASHP